ncbi:MAG TPA: hypothetical protein VE821_01375 [Pyrinomonadaceae bacterium]|nr:hypothetical protein [Pyrinomonadaceae bacterium]
MTKLKRRVRALPLVALALLVVGGGGAQLALDKVSDVRPGEVLDWTLTSVNEGTGAAREFKATGQIPKGTMLIVGSTTADGSAVVTYSIDNGKSYSTQPTIEEKQADGTLKRVSAPVSMYTQVRYEWSDALAAGGKLSAAYKVRVR